MLANCLIQRVFWFIKQLLNPKIIVFLPSTKHIQTLAIIKKKAVETRKSILL